MSSFEIYPSRVYGAADQYRNAAANLKNISTEVNSIMNGLRMGNTSSTLKVKESLKKSSQRIGRYGNKAQSYGNRLTNIASLYKNADGEVGGDKSKIGVIRADAKASVDSIYDLVTGACKTAWVTAAGVTFDSKFLNFSSTLTEHKRGDLFDGNGRSWNKKIEGEWVPRKKNKDGTYTKGHFQKKSDKKEEKTDKQKFADALDDITLAKAGIKGDRHLLSDEKKVEGKYGSASSKIEVGNLEYDMGVAATAGNVMASVGVAVSVLDIETKTQLGDDNFGFHTQGNVTVGRAEAKVSGGIGFLDDNGNFNPHFSGKASAEAIAAEAKGTVGVDLLGTKGDVTGSVNFGVGAHADVGFKDGHVTCDIGASLGVGASVKLDLDVSGTVEKVSAHAEEIGNTAVKIADTVGSTAKEAASRAGEFLGDIGSKVKDAGSFFGWKRW